MVFNFQRPPGAMPVQAASGPFTQGGPVLGAPPAPMRPPQVNPALLSKGLAPLAGPDMALAGGNMLGQMAGGNMLDQGMAGGNMLDQMQGGKGGGGGLGNFGTDSTAAILEALASGTAGGKGGGAPVSDAIPIPQDAGQQIDRAQRRRRRRRRRRRESRQRNAVSEALSAQQALDAFMPGMSATFPGTTMPLGNLGGAGRR